MQRTRYYAVVMALMLIGQCWSYNTFARDPHVLSAFPVLLGLLTVPAIMFVAVRQQSRSRGGPNRVILRQFGWSVLWPASLAFACFVGALSAAKFGPGHPFLALFGFVVAFGSTLVVGMAATELATLILTRTVVPTANGGAA